MRKLKRILLIFLLSLSSVSCMTYNTVKKSSGHVDIDPSKIKVQWIKQDEKAQFDGLLMTEETYKALREKIIALTKELTECKNK